MTDDRWLPSIRCMHEWPLVLFTALAVPGAGLAASRFLAQLVGIALPTHTYVSSIAAALLITGLALSFMHLGQPTRAPLALPRVGRNSLSTEVALVSLVAALALLQVLPRVPASARGWLDIINGAASMALLVAFGLVYFLRARWPWRSALVAAPVVSGLASGTVILCTMPATGSLQPLALILLVIDAVLSALVWRAPFDRPSLPAHPAVFCYRRRLLSLRVLFLDVLPVGFLLAGLRPSAAIAVTAGVLLDRFAFYGLALVESTEAVVADVQRRIQGV